MTWRKLVRSLGVTLVLTVAFAMVQASWPALSASDIETASLQVPKPGAGPSPEPADKPELRGGDVAAEQGPSDPGAQANPHRLPAHMPGPPREVEPRRYPDAAAFGQEKSRANANANANARNPGTSANGAVAAAARFATLTYEEGGRWNPPDGALAVGPSAVLVAVNETFRVYDKATGGPKIDSKGLQSFFGTGDSVFDPRALYDTDQGRFVMLAVSENSRARTATFMLAVSRIATIENPATDWCTYRLNAVTGSGSSAGWADFPSLGMDGDNLYITSNQFSFGRNAFQYARLLVVPKSKVYPQATGNTCPIASSWDFKDLRQPDGRGRSFTVQPADQPDARPGTSGPMHFVNALWSSGSNLVVRSVKWANGQPTLKPSYFVHSGRIGDYNISADAPQPNGGAIDTGDTRLLGAANRHGKVYTANTTQNVSDDVSSTKNPYANVQWYEITPRTTDTSADSVGRTYAVTHPTTAYYFPAVLPGGGTSPFVALSFSGSGSTPGQEVSAHYATATNGSPSVRRYQQGVEGYTLNGRWGDYHAVAVEPNGSDVWVLGQYAKSAAGWGTAIERVLAP